MRLLRLVAPGLIGLSLVAGFRVGMDWAVAQIEAPTPAAIPYAPGASPEGIERDERPHGPGLLAGL